MKRNSVKYIIYFLEAVFGFALQGTPYLMPELFGEKAVILLPLAVTVSFFEDESLSVILGAFCGMLADFAFNGSIGLFSISLAIVCYVFSVLSRRYIKVSFLSALSMGCLAVVLIMLMHFVLYFAFSGYNYIMQFFLTHYITRMIYTLAFVPLLIWLNRYISKGRFL